MNRLKKFAFILIALIIALTIVFLITTYVVDKKGALTIIKMLTAAVPKPFTVSCRTEPLTEADRNQAVKFIASVTGGSSPYKFSWTGDCVSSTNTCQTSFSEYGKKTATVTAIDKNKVVKTASCTVEIKKPLKVSCLIDRNPIPVNEQVTFSAKAEDGRKPYTYSWSNKKDCSGSQSTCSTKFSKEGTYKTLVTVRDFNYPGKDSQKSAECTVDVQPIPPLRASCEAKPNPALPEREVKFSSLVEGGRKPYTYSWSGACSGSQPTCSKKFLTKVEEKYTAFLTVRDSSFLHETVLCDVIVKIPPFEVSCEAKPNPALLGLDKEEVTVNFSSLVKGGVPPYTYFWSNACNGFKADCPKIFYKVGPYTADLNVIDFLGVKKSASCKVDVLSFLRASCEAKPNPAKTGEIVIFSSTVKGGVEPYWLSWKNACNPKPTDIPGKCSQVFPNQGLYTADLTVRDSSPWGVSETFTQCKVNIVPR
ncbi:MAG: hypothetical protein CEN87_335 [Parcubacteria group bacterium Licking1014_1]|nr:MAG: hypothetical protein CEN87_335 [Parcubacteria group bacterium Licking1014_1]